jgi:hypothetical protein
MWGRLSGLPSFIYLRVRMPQTSVCAEWRFLGGTLKPSPRGLGVYPTRHAQATRPVDVEEVKDSEKTRVIEIAV